MIYWPGSATFLGGAHWRIRCMPVPPLHMEQSSCRSSGWVHSGFQLQHQTTACTSLHRVATSSSSCREVSRDSHRPWKSLSKAFRRQSIKKLCPQVPDGLATVLLHHFYNSTIPQTLCHPKHWGEKIEDKVEPSFFSWQPPFFLQCLGPTKYLGHCGGTGDEQLYQAAAAERNSAIVVTKPLQKESAKKGKETNEKDEYGLDRK